MKFASVVLDVDSTLCGVEGIDWLAQRRGPEMADRVRAHREAWAGFVRAGASMIISYGARHAREWLS